MVEESHLGPEVANTERSGKLSGVLHGLQNFPEGNELSGFRNKRVVDLKKSSASGVVPFRRTMAPTKIRSGCDPNAVIVL